MTTQTYRGSCHCQRVTFEATLDLSKGSERCNCSYCTKVRNWVVITTPSAFKLLTGEDALTDYSGKIPSAHQLFCRHCGVRPFGKGHHPHLGEYVSVVLSCLDDASPEALLEGPIRYGNGRDDDWMKPPAKTAHL